MGTLYQLPLVTIDSNTPSDFSSTSNPSSTQLEYFNRMYPNMIGYAVGTSPGGSYFDDRIGSTFPNEYVGFLISSGGSKYRIGYNHHSTSLLLDLRKRIASGYTYYAKSTVQVTTGIVIQTYEENIYLLPSYVDAYTSYEDLYNALSELAFEPINYRLTNCTAPQAPTEAAIGSTVTVPLVFPPNYGVVNTSNAYVTNNGVVIPSSYSNGVLTFTMPDPSQ